MRASTSGWKLRTGLKEKKLRDQLIRYDSAIGISLAEYHTEQSLQYRLPYHAMRTRYHFWCMYVLYCTDYRVLTTDLISTGIGARATVEPYHTAAAYIS